MNSSDIMQMAENHLIHTYNRYPIVLDHGEGVHLYDTDGKEYLDFGAGIAVFAFGYNNREFNDALKIQIDKLIHTSNFFYNEPMAKAANVLTRAAGMDKVFFTNSGTEAIEGALKLAKKYGYERDGRTDHEIIAMEHSFHGRSMGALALTGNKHYQEAFGPMIPGIKFAKYNDLDSVRELINEKTIAVIMETVQGEGGIHPATPEFIKGVRKLCDEHGMLMMLDEIQCGLCRTGTLYAFEQYDVLPDVMTTAKALGQGVPVGAFMARGKAADVLVPGDHGSTYGGNPFAAAAVCKTFEMFESHKLTEHVKKITPVLEAAFDELVERFDFVTERRGMGLMQGIVVTVKPADVIKKALDEGLILFAAGADVIRFVPPLVITEGDVLEMKEKLGKVFESIK